MIWYYIALFLGSILTFFFSFLPIVDTLPFGVDEFLSNGVAYYNYLNEFLPFLSAIMTASLFYFGYRIIMSLLNVFKIYHE